ARRSAVGADLAGSEGPVRNRIGGPRRARQIENSVRALPRPSADPHDGRCATFVEEMSRSCDYGFGSDAATISATSSNLGGFSEIEGRASRNIVLQNGHAAATISAPVDANSRARL